MSVNCRTCKQLDDETHRINHCRKYKETNLHDSAQKINFSDVYSNDPLIIKNVLPYIEKVWNTRNAHGTMLR